MNAQDHAENDQRTNNVYLLLSSISKKIVLLHGNKQIKWKSLIRHMYIERPTPGTVKASYENIGGFKRL